MEANRELSEETKRFMNDNCPHPTEDRIETEETGTFDAETGKLSFVSVGNYFYGTTALLKDPATVKAFPVRHLHVHNGDIWNCAESALSEVVNKNAASLESVYYCPNDTKGGVMIRPWYCQSDRNKSLLFPNLTSVTLQSSGLSTFVRTWIAPNLKQLQIAFQKPIDIPVVVERLRSILDELKGFYPNLKLVRFFVKATNTTIIELKHQG